ncbi:reticulon-1-like isoform X2 [Polyodon spathula]|uniref:reticulon-1-like isoform X2 n=1 Tax=Polyodon spathula TaxID=7913 RepID=UPI001B7F1432|nr:reticulon-1-like isoform X2 [Polyodon spathula]
MSVNPSEGSGSEGKWFGEDFEQIDRFGRSVPRFGEADAELAADLKQKSWKDEAADQQQLQPESNQQSPAPVTMETASTEDPEDMYSDGLAPLASRKSTRDDGALYTSLLSNHSYSNQQETSYFTGDVKREHTPELKPSRDRIPSFESHTMFSSDSGMEVTPGESVDVAKKLMESEKMEAYNYIYISSSEDVRPQQQQEEEEEEEKEEEANWTEKTDGVKTASQMLTNLGDYSEKKSSEVVETVGAALEMHSCPYVEEPSDQELSNYQSFGIMGTPQKVSSVKITLTEIDTVVEPKVTVSERDSILSIGLEGVPTVTLSEPEDDSPGSSTPPYTEESDSPSEFAFHMGENKQPGCPVTGQEAPPAQGPPSPTTGKHTASPKPPALSSFPSSQDQEGSSAESGDSEIELVSEEPLAAEELGRSNYMTFGQVGGPPPSPTSPSIQYSILREEREAELDSELIIESCDASSASEESPKREQDSLVMKPLAGDSKLGECLPASHPIATEFQPATLKEKQASEKMKNLINSEDSAAKSKHSFVTPEVRAEHPTAEEKVSRKSSQTKPATAEAACKKEAQVKESGAEKTASPELFDWQKAIDLLYWRDLKQTGILLGSLLLLLFSLTQFSVVSVIAYLALAALSATISFRIYKSVLQAIQKTDEGHPFKAYLDLEISLSQEQIQKYADNAQLYLNSTLKELRRLFLVQDLVDSLKFAVLMWLLTYVGALFNGLTLLIMAVISMFTMPVVYEKYQAQIDQYLGLVRTHVNSVIGKIQAKIPGAKSKAE